MGKRIVASVKSPGRKGVQHGIKKKPMKKGVKSVGNRKKNVNAIENVPLSLKSEIVSTENPEIGDQVDVKWEDGTLYNAKVMKIENKKCLLHYRGWNSKYDEWVKLGKKTSSKKALKEISNIENSSNKKLNAIKRIQKGIEESEITKESDDSDEHENDPEMEGLCEYEKIRLRNIRERQAMFDLLQLNEAKTELKQAITPDKVKQLPSKRGLVGVKREKEILPLRKSTRLSGGKVPEIDRFVPLLESPEEDSSSVSLETLSLKETFNKSSEPGSLQYTEEFLKSMAALSSKKTENILGDNLTFSTSNLSIKEDQVAKVVPDRIFSLAMHPSSNPLVVAVGDKSGHVGLWNILATDSPNHGVHLYQPHSRPINCLTWDCSNTTNLISTSYDGTSRVFDLEKQEHLMLYGEQDFISKGGWTSSHAQVSNDVYLISKGDTGSIAMIDRRVGWESPVNNYQVFDRIHAKTISIHPVQSSMFLTCNNKGGCYIFDTRNISTSTKLMAPVSELLGHTRSLSCSYFSPISGNQVVTMCTDDKIRLFNTSDIKATLTPQCQIRHNNNTGRWLTPFRAAWHPSLDGMLVTGSMERPRQIEVWQTKTGSLENVKKLMGDDLGSVCSLVGIHPSNEVIAGANSSGRVHVFM